MLIEQSDEWNPMEWNPMEWNLMKSNPMSRMFNESNSIEPNVESVGVYPGVD